MRVGVVVAVSRFLTSGSDYIDKDQGRGCRIENLGSRVWNFRIASSGSAVACVGCSVGGGHGPVGVENLPKHSNPYKYDAHLCKLPHKLRKRQHEPSTREAHAFVSSKLLLTMPLNSNSKAYQQPPESSPTT